MLDNDAMTQDCMDLFGETPRSMANQLKLYHYSRNSSINTDRKKRAIRVQRGVDMGDLKHFVCVGGSSQEECDVPPTTGLFRTKVCNRLRRHRRDLADRCWQ